MSFRCPLSRPVRLSKQALARETNRNENLQPTPAGPPSATSANRDTAGLHLPALLQKRGGVLIGGQRRMAELLGLPCAPFGFEEWPAAPDGTSGTDQRCHEPACGVIAGRGQRPLTADRTEVRLHGNSTKGGPKAALSIGSAHRRGRRRKLCHARTAADGVRRGSGPPSCDECGNRHSLHEAQGTRCLEAIPGQPTSTSRGRARGAQCPELGRPCRTERAGEPAVWPRQVRRGFAL